jgi:hypothetical protein
MARISGLLSDLDIKLAGACFLLVLVFGFVLTMIGAGITSLGGYVARAGDAFVLFVGEHCEDFE